MDRNVNIIVGLKGEKIVLINDIRFKGKKREDWKEVEDYLKEYVGEFYEIADTSEKIFISSSFLERGCCEGQSKCGAGDTGVDSNCQEWGILGKYEKEA